VKKSNKFIVGGLVLPILILASALIIEFGLEWQRNASLECRVAAFMYHVVIPDSLEGTRFAIRSSDFEHQLRELDEAGVRVVDPFMSGAPQGSLNTAISEWCRDHDRVAMITFDAETPSYHSELSVPALRERNMLGAYFVVTGSLDTPHWVNWDDVTFMLDQGMRVGSHSHRHPLMTRIPAELVRADLTESLSTLREVPVTEPVMFALPGGRYDPQVLSIARHVGFGQIFTSDPCYLQEDTPTYRICRIEVRGDGGPTPNEFLDSPFQVSVQGYSWRWKRRIEGVLGDRIWGFLSDMGYNR